MKKNGAILLVFVTVVLTHFTLVRWVPAMINEKAAVVLKDKVSPKLPNPNPENSDTAVSDDLLNYIKEKRQVAASASDQMDYSELLQRVEEFEQESAKNSDQFLDQRFDKWGSGSSVAYTSDVSSFDVPEGLNGIVNFWKHIFGIYGKNHVIFYNKDDVSIVYSVLDFTDLVQMNPDSAAGIQSQMVKQESYRLQNMLAKISKILKRGGPDLASLTGEERHLYEELKANSDHVAVSESGLKASFSYRNGFAHRIREALIESGRYLPEMQRIFSERGLPTELTMIPFIESAFYQRAYSSAGAAGLWQFIEATGRNYLRIDDYVDERYDPILATYAAAAHLASEFGLLKSWPLTINGYNTGPGRMMQAVKELRTNSIEKIVKFFRGSGYGFDSRNYYPEFLAMLDVYQNREKYFGSLPEEELEAYDYIKLPAATNLKQLVRAAGLNESSLRSLNTALKENVLSGAKSLPKGYLVKIPPELKDTVLLAAQELYKDRMFASYHVVEKGEDLKEIAKQYGLTLAELQEANDIFPGEQIKKGDILKLPQPEDSEFSIARPGEKDAIDVKELLGQ